MWLDSFGRFICFYRYSNGRVLFGEGKSGTDQIMKATMMFELFKKISV